MKKSFFTIALLVFLFVPLSAVFSQSSEKISEYLDEDFLTNEQISYLAAVYKNLVPEDSDYTQAFEALKNENLFPKDASGEKLADLETVAKVYADATGIKGGILYTLTKSKRYAFKELKAKGILPETADPSTRVTGRDAIAIFNGCIETTVGN